MLVRKKAKILRICAENRKQSAVIVFDLYPFLRLNEREDCLVNDEVLSILKQKSAYRRTEVNKSGKAKKIILFYQVLYQFTYI